MTGPLPELYPVYIGRRFFTSGSGNRLASFVSVLAISGLILGIALMIVVMSVMNGFDREMRQRILGVVPHLQIFAAGGIPEWSQVAERVMEHDNVLEATPFTRFQGMVNFHGKVQAVEVQGLQPDFIDSALKAVLPVDTADWLNQDKMLLSASLAEKLGVSPGDRLTLIVPGLDTSGRQSMPSFRVFEFAGSLATHTAADNQMALISLRAAGQVTGLGDLPQGLRLRTADIFDVRNTGYQLLGVLPSGFSFMDWFQTHGNLYQAIKMSRNLVGLLLFLIIAVAVFNVVAMLVMTVVEKRPAIAILKTLGAGNRGILGVFLVQGFLIGLFGSLLGVLLGIAGAVYIPDIVVWLEQIFGHQFLVTEVYPIDYIPSDLRFEDVATVVMVALFLNFLATLYPAWKASKIRPAEILRYE